MGEENPTQGTLSHSESIKEDEMTEEKETPTRLSRKDFVKGAAAVAGAGALASCAPAATPAPTTAPGATAAPCPTCPPAEECAPCPTGVPETWDYEADVVVAGSGATGLPAAVEAVEGGASVIMIERNYDVGGNAIINGGIVGLGGGTRLQKELGFEDSADKIFEGLTDPKSLSAKKNDPAMMRAYADLCADSNKWLEDHGVEWIGIWGPPPIPGVSGGGSAHVASWKEQGTARGPGVLFTFFEDPELTSSGAGVFRPLEDAAREQGVEILLEHKLTGIIREKPLEGEVLGVEAEHNGEKVYIRAAKGVIIATGGAKSGQLRRAYDPRLNEEYQADGEPFAICDGGGIIAAQAIGGQLASDFAIDGHWIMPRVPTHTVMPRNQGGPIGCKYAGVHYFGFPPGTPMYDLQGAEGLEVKEPQDLIHVKKSGLRFFDEATWDEIGYCDAAYADGGGPIWAIFDADAAEREGWVLEPPKIDPEYFFSGDTIAELADKITWNGIGVPAAALEETVEKYNSYVDLGEDPDFERPTPMYKIQTPPFYAAWATPICHNPHSGLRINEKTQVIDIYGEVIPGLYAGGEAAGGSSLAGVGEGIVQGRIAAMDAVAR